MTSTQELLDRLEDLDSRLRAREDEAEILRLIAGYFPAVDSGRADEVASIWEPDGVYDVDTGVLNGRDEIAAMVRGDDHQGLIGHGSAHLCGLPEVRVDGDTAVATGHSLLVVRSSRPGRYTVMRATANRWELRRSDDGWRVTRRIARVLAEDGSGRDVLAGRT